MKSEKYWETKQWWVGKFYVSQQMYKCSPWKKDKRKKTEMNDVKIFKFCEKNMNLDQEVQQTKREKKKPKKTIFLYLSHFCIFFLAKML